MIKYRSEIDGLRAISIIPVIFYHGNFPYFSGGFIGVDVFFVMSGYLITQLILTPNFSFKEFYIRRARRILPALYFLILVITFFSFFILTPKYLADFSRSILYVLSFTSNIFFWKSSGYFNPSSELQPLVHTWSLSIEEQFYILFPLLIFQLKRLKINYLISVVLALFLISFFLSILITPIKPAASFYLLPTRAWEMLLGSLLVFVSRVFILSRFKIIILDCISGSGLALILLSIFFISPSTEFPGSIALIPVLGAALIIVFTSPSGFIYKLLSIRILVFIGVISYSLYLWHQPIFSLVRHLDFRGDYINLFVLIFFIIPLSLFSFFIIERPFRYFFDNRKMILFLLISALILILFSVSSNLTNGFSKLYSSFRFNEAEYINYLQIKKHIDYDVNEYMYDNLDCKFSSPKIDKYTELRFNKCSEKYGKAIIILGDSHAMGIFNSFSKSNNYNFIVGFVAGGCRPNLSSDNCQYLDFLNFSLKNFQSIKFVLYHQAGSYLLADKYGIVDSSRVFQEGESYSFSDKNINNTLFYLSKLNKILTVYWLGPYTESRVNFELIKTFKNFNLTINNRVLTIFHKLDIYIKYYIPKYDIFPIDNYISFNEIISIDENFLLSGDCITFRDTDHFSRCGEDIVSKNIYKLNLFH